MKHVLTPEETNLLHEYGFTIGAKSWAASDSWILGKVTVSAPGRWLQSTDWRNARGEWNLCYELKHDWHSFNLAELLARAALEGLL